MATSNNTDDARTESETLAAAHDSLKGVESLADTPFSALFHEARTAKSHVSGVALPVRVSDGELEVGEPVTTRQGEHFRPADRWNWKITLPTRAFMEVQTARQHIRTQLRDAERKAAAKEQRERERNRTDPRVN